MVKNENSSEEGAYGGTGGPSSEYKEFYSFFFYFDAYIQQNMTCDM